MAQLHCYVPDKLAEQVQQRANQAGLSLPLYLAELIKRDVATESAWTEAFFDNLGTWEGVRLERLED